MSLRTKILLVLAAVMALYATSDFAVRELLIAPTFLAHEHQQAREDVQRVREALRDEIEDLHELARAWASRDESWRWIASGGSEYERSFLGERTLAEARIDLLIACDLEGRVRWYHARDPDSGRELALRMFPREALSPGHSLLAARAAEPDGGARPIRGLLLTEHAPMLVSARPVLPSSTEGAARGTLITGRFLGQGLEDELTRRTEVPFDFWQLDGRGALPPAVAEVVDAATASTVPQIRASGDDLLHAWASFADVRGRPDFLIRAEVPREITRAGGVALRYALLSMVAACLLVLLALLGLLQKIVLTPLSLLTRHAVSIGQNEDFTAKIELERADELGILSREFDQMMVKLEEARRALVETARTAGMSEIATGILHNVGNVLNSVNISTGLVVQRVEELPLADLRAVVAALDEHGEALADFLESDPRGQHLRPFLRALAEHMSEEHAQVRQELGELASGIVHIRELVRAQQDYAYQSEMVEPVSIVEQVEEALGITAKAVAPRAQVEVVHDHEPLPRLLLDRHRLLEILVNLIQNARQAMEQPGAGPQRRLTLSSRRAAPDRLRIEVRDSGAGIAREDLTRVFQMGWTTRPGGHGFGLHAAANAATEMGGTIAAESPGPGRGATFVLELPFRPHVLPVRAA